MITEILGFVSQLPPGLSLILGALLVPFLRGRYLQVWLVLLPLVSLAHMLWMPNDMRVELSCLGLTLTPVRMDKLSLVWGYIFHFATLVSVVFALQVKDRIQQSMALVYAGSAIAAVFAGDLLTLFLFWEITAISSVFLVWAGKSKAAYGAGMRYLVIQVTSGVLLLAGTILHYQGTGSLDFQGPWSVRDGVPMVLLFCAFGIKAAFPLLHCWLPDAYPVATPTGTVFLSIYTTKLAIYSLARGFPGSQELVIIGTVMALFPLIYALLEDDLRRVLAYSLNNQLGFMVVAVGVGSDLALNGAAGHAVSHILYKGLLFMAVGAVITQTGSGKASELGGLLTAMPWTAAFCIIGALGMATPLFGGYVTKSMILSSVAKAHFDWIWLLLLISSAGVFLASGIRVCYEIFFGERRGMSVDDAPRNMRLAMALTAIALIAIGIAPRALVSILPYEADYNAYTLSHVINQLQLLLFSALGFAALVQFGFYPGRTGGTLLDFDWIYRALLPRFIRRARFLVQLGLFSVKSLIRSKLRGVGAMLDRIFSDTGIMGRSRSTGWMAMWAAILLAAYLFSYYEEQAMNGAATDIDTAPPPITRDTAPQE